MSSRALRKLQKEKEIDEISHSQNEEISGFEENQRSKNLFHHFADLSDDQDTEESDSSQSDNEEASDTINSKTLKSTNKKGNTPVILDSDEEFDKLFEKHCETNSNASELLHNATQSNPINEALSIDPLWLDANSELKKKFGGAVNGGNSVLSEINSRALRQHNPALLRAVKRKPYKRKNGFITPRPLWPPFGPTDVNLSVKLSYACPDFNEYEIIESDDYQHIFEELEMLVRTGDLEFLIQMIHAQPLFVDGLLLLSDAYRMQSTGDAGEIVERALYILERILPVDLSFIDGKTRFRYSHPGNRKLHLCLFRHLQFTMKKGCWRVSLQLAKTLLALDPEIDPLGTRLFLDFLTIHTESFEEFDKIFVNFKGISKFGPILPGWYYNNALRAFFDEEHQKSDHSFSSQLLSEAFSKCPVTGLLLLEALKLKLPELPNCPDFQSDFSLIGASKIFVSRCFTLWKTPSIQKWLESTLISVPLKSFENCVTFKTDPLAHQVSIFRHSLLSDLPSLNIAIPKEITEVSSLDSYDPLPPESFDEPKAVGFKSLIQSFTNLFNMNRQE